MNEQNQLTEFNPGTDIEVIEAGQRAEYDIQIATAKRYPRNLSRVKENCLAIVTMDKETAASCRYALPRGGKTISGPSVHLARILAQQYGNVRVDARVRQITDKQIISEAVAFDLETNYAVKIEVRRSIVNKYGKRYYDDMITVTGNAANAISFRNAVLAVIPKGLTDISYNAALRQITGDLTSEDKIIAARTKAIEYFKANYNVSEEQILKAINLRSINQIKEEEIADLRGIMQAIKDGDTTPEEVFQIATKTEDLPKPELKIGTPAFDRAVKKLQAGGTIEQIAEQFSVDQETHNALIDATMELSPKEVANELNNVMKTYREKTGELYPDPPVIVQPEAPKPPKREPKGREWQKPAEDGTLGLDGATNTREE